MNRWASTVQGPKKLIAVLTHDKYPIDLRVEAALALIRMKPRNGRRVGIEGSDDQPGLMASLAQMAPAERTALVARLVPALEAEIKKPPPVAQGGQVAADPSIPYKDAAFALLKHEGGRLVPDDQLRKRLRDALAGWICVNFAQRFDDSTQMYSVKQMVGDLRAEAVRCLPNQMLPGAPKVDAMAELVADHGDPPTRLAASQRLVAIGNETASEAWIRQKSPGVEAANKAAKLTPTAEQFRQQLEQYQEEELVRVFTSMKRVGGAPVVDFLLTYVQDTKQSPKRRAAALAALAGSPRPEQRQARRRRARGRGRARHPGPGSRRRASARRRVPAADGREPPLWSVRFEDVEGSLGRSRARAPDERHEPAPGVLRQHRKSPRHGHHRTAPLRGSDGRNEGPDEARGRRRRPTSARAAPVPARVTALGYYYNRGTAADLPKLSHFASDRTKTPTCAEDDKDCEWKCEVDADGKRETKDITTVGEFFDFCVKPAMEKRPAR